MSGFESRVWCPICRSVNGSWTDNGFTTCNKCGRASIFEKEDLTSQVEDFTVDVNTRMGFLEMRLREIDVVLTERLSRGSGNSCVSCGVLTPKSMNMCSLCLKKHDNLEREHKNCSPCVDKKITSDHKLSLWCPDCQGVKDVKTDNGVPKCNVCDRLLISVREACRRRIPLDGVDAECLEHALTQTEQELSALRRELNQVKSEADDTMIVFLETRTKLKHANEEIERLVQLYHRDGLS
jgi:hypothetical protein